VIGSGQKQPPLTAESGDSFAATAAITCPDVRQLLAAECGDEIRAARVTAFAIQAAVVVRMVCHERAPRRAERGAIAIA
jgi:hypothetical protein